MKKQLSQRALKVSPSATLSIDAKFKKMKADGIDVVGFGAGEPDFDTPDYIKAAAFDAINKGHTKYTPASGLLPLKMAVCKKLEKENNVTYNPSQIVIGNGAKHCLYNTLNALLNPGDEVILPAPYWVSYYELIVMAGGVPVILHTLEEDNFTFTKQQLQSLVTDKTKAVIINSPSNPTGMILPKELLMDVAEICVREGIYVISDEIYEKLIYDDNKHVSIASFSEEIKDLTIIINGVSKSFAMTGWRIGYSASNQQIATVMSNYQSHATSNPNSIAQYAALEALTKEDDSLEKMRVEFAKRRDYMVNRINSIPMVSCKKPTGAFYVMMNVSKLFGKSYKGTAIKDVDHLCELLLENVGLSIVPCTSFDAPNFVRWSYATSMQTIKEGLDRLEKFISNI